MPYNAKQSFTSDTSSTESSVLVETESHGPDPFSADEIKKIITVAGAAMSNQILFAMGTGLRTGELIALRERDLDLGNNRIVVPYSSRSIYRGSSRSVDLLPTAREALEAQMKLLGCPDGHVFPNPSTKKRWTTVKAIHKRWKAILTKAGVRYRTPYHMRHTYASTMLSAGENIFYVAKQMGHADWSMLVTFYGPWLPHSAAG